MRTYRDAPPIGSLLTPRQERIEGVLPQSRLIVYLGWDADHNGMRILFPDGIVSTHDISDIFYWFEVAQ